MKWINGRMWSNEMMFLSAKTPNHFLQEDAHLLRITLIMQSFLNISSFFLFCSFSYKFCYIRKKRSKKMQVTSSFHGSRMWLKYGTEPTTRSRRTQHWDIKAHLGKAKECFIEKRLLKWYPQDLLRQFRESRYSIQTKEHEQWGVGGHIQWLHQFWMARTKDRSCEIRRG